MKDKDDSLFAPTSKATRTINTAKRSLRRLRQILMRRRILALIFTGLLLYHFLSNSGLWFLPAFRWGSSKFVIILAVNQGGGVMQWKGPQEWAVERTSIANKRAYADKHGYDLAIQDMSIKKRYAHEWRESWEKVDVIRQTMKQYPKAEWFWWVDLHTYIMEPSVTLERQVFNRLDNVTYRNISSYNPLALPTNLPFVESNHQINMIIPQDCGGFNLGSFFIRRSEWTDFLLDIWWDPVFYEQRHMQWEHKEQDALEHLYTGQAWIRSGIAFIPQRLINSFPPGACNDQAGDRRIFYNEEDRDFVVNMAGCEWGRDCYGEMEHYKQLSLDLQKRKRSWFSLWS
ncbi:galactosyl transferase GMA12/MNN10 family-domain-containing protein [Limtongia smithiae]|uniref:galactosyl transferase GMA12/MNN10 family-domain-containing protein n=1 Tax=Limtongia smithiae TaxID=1125753 RepID=UPI0034CEFC6A